MEASIVKRSIIVGGHKTGVSLEDPFWNAVKEIAGLGNVRVAALIGQIDNDREHSNLSSAIPASRFCGLITVSRVSLADSCSI